MRQEIKGVIVIEMKVRAVGVFDSSVRNFSKATYITVLFVKCTHLILMTHDL